MSLLAGYLLRDKTIALVILENRIHRDCARAIEERNNGRFPGRKASVSVFRASTTRISRSVNLDEQAFNALPVTTSWLATLRDH